MTKPFAWSYSALNNFETCAKKYYHGSIKKDFVEADGVHRTWGFEVHKAMADRIMKSRPLPLGMEKWEKWADWALTNVDRTQVIIRCEHQMAVTERLQPCEYFDKKVQPWFRTVADVIKIRMPYLRIIDWKTGKTKDDDDQLQLLAATAFAHYPEAEVAALHFVWLQEDCKTDRVFRRQDIGFLWERMLPRVGEMQVAYATSRYDARPSGLCKNHCPVTICPHHGRPGYTP